MEDAVTHTDAQRVVAAVLYLGTRVVAALRQRLAHPNRLVLRAPGLAPTRDNAARLQALATRAARHTLGASPSAVVATPDRRGGFRVHLAFAQCPPLQPQERADLAHAWEQLKQREFGRHQPARESGDVVARRLDAYRAMDTLRRAQTNYFAAPSPETRAALERARDGVHRANDAVRAAHPRNQPGAPARQPHHDKLQFLVKLQGDGGLTLYERDQVVRQALARAAALRNPNALQVTLRPAPAPDTWRAHVAFNLRDTATRQPHHINPAALEKAAITPGPEGAAAAVAVKVATTSVQVALTALQSTREPTKAALAQGVQLPPPAPMRATPALERARL